MTAEGAGVVGLRGRYDFFAVEYDGYGTIVYQGDLHHCLEAAGFDLGDMAAENFYKLFEGLTGLIRRCGTDIAGAAALAAVGEKSELAYGQDAAAVFDAGLVHFPLVVGKDAEVGDLFGHGFHDLGGIVRGHAYKKEKAGSD